VDIGRYLVEAQVRATRLPAIGELQREDKNYRSVILEKVLS
jgi:hypothetical protein